jgi:hypothetical protein
MVYTEVMANISNKQARKLTKASTLHYKKSIAADKRTLLGKPETPGDRKHDKRIARKFAVLDELSAKTDKLSRNGQFQEARNIQDNHYAKSNIKLNALFNPKLEKRSDRSENPGPKSGFLSKAKNK